MPPKKIKRNQIEGQQKSREKFQKVCELLHQRYQRGWENNPLLRICEFIQQIMQECQIDMEVENLYVTFALRSPNKSQNPNSSTSTFVHFIIHFLV